MADKPNHDEFSEMFFSAPSRGSGRELSEEARQATRKVVASAAQGAKIAASKLSWMLQTVICKQTGKPYLEPVHYESGKNKGELNRYAYLPAVAQFLRSFSELTDHMGKGFQFFKK